MPQNPVGAQDCSIEVFGSWVTETAAANLPIGVSPDCPDNVFAPGTVGTRPAFQKIFNPPLEANSTITYGKSFVTSNGGIKNLYLSSTGKFYVEDVIATPGTATLLFTTTPRTYAKSITAFGREYIAISDGLHGQEVPLQFDGDNLDRVTQDGPGAPPSVTSLPFPSFALSASTGVATTITSIETTDLHLLPFGGGGFYQTFTVELATPVLEVVGELVTIAGNTGPFNGAWAIASVIDTTHYKVSSYSASFFSGTGGTSTTPSASMVRSGNTVTAYLSVFASEIQIGYQVQIAGVTASQLGGGIASVTINNEDLPGIATITTNSAHGLTPDLDVFLNDIPSNALTVATYTTANNVANVVTPAAHNLSVGSSLLVALGSGQPFSTTVSSVVSATEFLCFEPTGTATSGSGGSIQYLFPLATSATPNTQTYEVVAAPTPTTFQIAFEYTDGTWTGGTVSFAWDGTFYVTGIIEAQDAVQYQQYGPDATTSSAGTLTPYGQAAPGKHQLRMSYLTRQGYLTQPSPSVTFIADGGQYISIDDMAIGPPNIVARVLEFTGALGSQFFYLPVAGQVNGLVVSTGTQVNDNTTTNIVLDFSDNTLFAGLGTSIPGNNLAAQIVLDGALSFLYSSTRLGTFGQRNRLQNMLCMGFDGGSLRSAPTLPTGWTSTAAGGTQGAGRFNGFNWQIDTAVGPGTLSQSFYQNADGDPIGTSDTLYKIRYYITGAGTFRATISSASATFSTTATIVANGAGWYEATFLAETPAQIPADMLYTIEGTAGSFAVDEGSVIYAATPYLDTILYDSYVNNPEAFDGLSGKYGPTQDTRKVMAAGIVRGNLCLLTQEPSGRLHEVIDNGTTEPAGWSVNELEANCGILGAFALTSSQADDGSASGGEEWMSWMSESGARIFGGGDEWKISQEIQPNWFDPDNPAEVGGGQINMAAALTCWALNDPVARVVYFGVPLGASTAPSQIYPMNYREMDDAYTIAHSPPFHPSLGGKLVATDSTRKWCYWARAFNGAARMYRSAGELTTCFFAGNGLTPAGTGFGNVYRLNPNMSTDDDYGQINSYYVTCALPTHDQEQSLGLGAQKKMLASLNAFFTCVGLGVRFTIFRNAYKAGLPYQWPISFTRPSATYFDMEMPGGNPEANRMFIKVQPVPVAGQTDNRYALERLVPYFRKAKVPARGAAQ